MTSPRTTSRYFARSTPSLTSVSVYAASTASASISVTRPMRKIPSSPSMTSVGVFAVAPNRAVEERFVGLLVVLCQPAEIAGLRRGRGIGRDDLRDVVPALAALDVGERLVDRRPGGRDLFGGRRAGAAVGDGLDLDLPGVARLGGRGLLDEPCVDVGVGDRDALLGRELRLDPVVDDALERERQELLALLLDELRLERRPAPGSDDPRRPGC